MTQGAGFTSSAWAAKARPARARGISTVRVKAARARTKGTSIMARALRGDPQLLVAIMRLSVATAALAASLLVRLRLLVATAALAASLLVRLRLLVATAALVLLVVPLVVLLVAASSHPLAGKYHREVKPCRRKADFTAGSACAVIAVPA